MAAPVKLTKAEGLALAAELVAVLGAPAVSAALVSVIGADRAQGILAAKEGRISKAETVALVKAIIPLVPGADLKAKIKVAIAALRRAIPDKARADAILAYVLQKIKDYKVPPPAVPAAPIVNDGFLRLYGRSNMWCAGGEDLLRQDVTLCAALGVGYQIEMAGWRPGQTAFDGEDKLAATMAMYRKLQGWCKQSGIPLLVSITNWNITQSKYGNKGRPFASIVPAAKRLAECVFDCGGMDFVYVQPVAETNPKDKAATDFEKWCGTLFSGWKLVYNGGSRPQKPSYGWPHFAVHPSSTSDGGVRGGISISDTGSIIKQLAADGTLDGPGNPAKIADWFARCKAGGAIGAGYYAFLRTSHDAAAIRACAARSNAPEQSLPAGSWPSELSSVTWLHSNVLDWAVTTTVKPSISNGQINLPFDKTNAWPAINYDGGMVNANPWAIVNIGGKWYAGTWEWMRKGQTSKPKGCLDHTGGKGDHFKKSPLNKWTPKSGEEFYLMVSGLARSNIRNVEERSNPVKVRWP